MVKPNETIHPAGDYGKEMLAIIITQISQKSRSSQHIIPSYFKMDVCKKPKLSYPVMARTPWPHLSSLIQLPGLFVQSLCKSF